MSDRSNSKFERAPDERARKRATARAIFDHALAECDIAKAFSRHIRYHNGSLHVQDQVYDFNSFDRKIVISIGKAGHSMAQALSAITTGGLEGIIAAPDTPAEPVSGFRYFRGGHPLPNEESLRAGEAILDLLQNSSPSTLVVYCISGGASAIAEKPVLGHITLTDVVATYQALVHSGAPIAEINAIRKHLSALKGGRIAQAAYPARQVSILVSDVPERALDALGSGPTMPDSTTVADCYALAEHYRLRDRLPASIRALFDQRQLQETPKTGDPIFEHSRYCTVLSNATAQKAAAECATSAGWNVEADNSCDDRDYQEAADHLLRRLRELRQNGKLVCLISGGEVTVQVSGESGLGGRNQQFALYCAQQIDGESIAILSAGTDGIDGSSPAAGAVVDGTTIDRARLNGFDAQSALREFNTYPLFEALGDAVTTGPTGNNVRDLRILLAG